ncbi:hypothetical protein QVD17_12983 [Tagetes erecta]|uniref:Uncharacterized protein n=1 Tax=Tagetes erecta TaxID=13708 RepID=A0AAD8L057_TARER|nr:hypothetical protein QVD17_12983 [Tagetes erecta]
MASLMSFYLYTLLTISLSFNLIYAKQNFVIINQVPNHGGGIKFEKVIGGIAYTRPLMAKINQYIWNVIFKQTNPADRKAVDTVELFIKDYDGAEGVTWGNNKINVSAIYLNEYRGPMTLKWEFTSLMYHEMTHVFQWNGEGKCPVGLVEGIADYTILRANYYPPGFAPKGRGLRWDEGYDITARFLEYCDGLVPEFTSKLNNMMRRTYDVSFFQQLTGKPVDVLWQEYKAKNPYTPPPAGV